MRKWSGFFSASFSFHLSIGFRKHVSEAFFVIYTQAWAPKLILPHMVIALRGGEPGEQCPAEETK